MSMTPPTTPTTGTVIYQGRSDENWSGVASRAGSTMTTTDGKLTWTPPPLRAGRPHTITARVWATGWATTGATASVLIQGRPFSVPARTWTTVSAPVDTTRPVRVELSPVAQADITLTVSTPDVVPSDPIPADVLALEAWLPIPTAAMRWDISRWDRSSWNSPSTVEGTLIWDRGRWDENYWEDTALTETWTPILGPGTRLAVSRGVESNGPVLAAQAGTLALTATDELNPRSLGMTWGTPVRLYHWPTATLIWTGWITDLSTTPAKTGRGSTTITATDAVARLVAITRYGARPDNGRAETWRQRLARLMQSAPEGMTYRVATTSEAPVCPTVWETDLASHLDALVATTGGAWCVDRSGGLEFWATLPAGAPALTLTDTHDTRGPGEVIPYTAGPSTWTAARVIAGIESTTHDAAPDENGEWRAADTTVTIKDTTTSASWGGMSVRVDLMTPSQGPYTERAAKRLLRRASDAPLLEAAAWWPVSKRTKGHTQAHAMEVAARLDPLTPVTGIARGETTDALIARVTHDITPTTWKTELDLTTRKDN